MEAKILGSKNSHKYFPEFMIKAFYGKKPIAFLNAKTGRIDTVNKSGDYNAQLGWYTDKNEEILNEEAEQKFQQLSREINKMARSGNRDFSRLTMDTDLAYKFFAYQIIRDPANSKVILSELSARGGIKTRMTLQDFQNEAIKTEKTAHIVTDALREAFVVVLEPNFTEMDYVAVNVPVMIKFADDKMYVLAVAPKVAFCLVSRKINNKLHLGSVRDDGINCVIQTNEHIMAHAIAHEPHEVLGRDPEYLKRLRHEVKVKIDKYGHR